MKRETIAARSGCARHLCRSSRTQLRAAELPTEDKDRGRSPYAGRGPAAAFAARSVAARGYRVCGRWPSAVAVAGLCGVRAITADKGEAASAAGPIGVVCRSGAVCMGRTSLVCGSAPRRAGAATLCALCKRAAPAPNRRCLHFANGLGRHKPPLRAACNGVPGSASVVCGSARPGGGPASLVRRSARRGGGANARCLHLGEPCGAPDYGCRRFADRLPVFAPRCRPIPDRLPVFARRCGPIPDRLPR